MSATNRNDGIAKPGVGVDPQAPHIKGEIQDIDPDQDPLRPATAHGQAQEDVAGQAKEGTGAQAKDGATFAPRDIDPKQDGTGAC